MVYFLTVESGRLEAHRHGVDLLQRHIVPEPSGCLKLLLFDVKTDFKVLSKSGAKDFGMYLGKTPTVLDAFDIAR